MSWAEAKRKQSDVHKKKMTRYTAEGTGYNSPIFKVFTPRLGCRWRGKFRQLFEYPPEHWEAGKTPSISRSKRNRCNGGGRNCRNLQVKDEVVKALFLYAVVEANCGRQKHKGKSLNYANFYSNSSPKNFN